MQEIKQGLTMEEELFCTRYESEILSGIVNDGRLERWVPGFCSAHTHKEHLARYDWVKHFVKDKTVLDIACGAGFGSYLLAKDGHAANVTGYDIDESTIRYASIRNRHWGLQFEVANAEQFETNSPYEIIVSFETIEHLDSPEMFLRNINIALAPNGTCFISTPISGVEEDLHPDNCYHKKEWGFKKFHELMGHYLRITGVYLQLYHTPPSNAGFLSKVLHKAGLKHNDHPDIIEKLTPHKWDPETLSEHSIGKDWTGYQVLQCSKRTDAGV